MGASLTMITNRDKERIVEKVARRSTDYKTLTQEIEVTFLPEWILIDKGEQDDTTRTNKLSG